MEEYREMHHLYYMPRKVDTTTIENLAFKRALGSVIVGLRRERGLSQERLALTAEIDRTRMSQIERGEANSGIDTLIKIGRILEVSLGSLIERAEKSMD